MRHAFPLLAALGLCGAEVRADLPAVVFDGGNVSRDMLGDGTGVIIGIVDSGVDSSQPLLTGTDSLGNPRLVAEANLVTYEPLNSGSDVSGHGTAVAGLILARGTGVNADDAGFAPDARYINARVLDSSTSFVSNDQVVSGISFALANHADIINLSMAVSATQSDGRSQLDLLVDYVVDHYGVFVTVAAGNTGSGHPSHSPGAAANGVTVGALTADYSRVATFSSGGPTADGRSKPDLVAPGTSVLTANKNWQSGSVLVSGSGSSFSAPQVAGLAAQMIDYGRNHALSTDTRVLQAVIMNSADQTLDASGASWSHTSQLPLDAEQGTGALNAVAAATQYLAGQFGPGNVPHEGWALNTIIGANTVNTTLDKYMLDLSPLVGSYIDATLIWNQHVTWHDSGTLGIIDPNDFFTANAHDELDLYLYRDGQKVAESISTVDNLQYIHFLVTQAGQYQLLVTQPAAIGSGETYSLAWNATAVPEPASLALLATGSLSLVFIVRRRRQSARSR